MAAETDLRTILGILAEAAVWMRDERGIRDQWSPVVPEAPFAQAIRDGEQFLICSGSEVAGTMRIHHADPVVWGPDDGTALYCHSLAIRRRYAGQGLGGAALDAAQERGSALGRDVIRLDCVASNRGLRRFYEGLGFASRGTITRRHEDGSPWTAARYQRAARA